jgi:hypothetical protein
LIENRRIAGLTPVCARAFCFVVAARCFGIAAEDVGLAGKMKDDNFQIEYGK